MDVYKIMTQYDERGNSPWDALWYDGGDEDLDPLDSEIRLAAVWAPPVVRLERRHKTPDIYVLHVYRVVTTPARELLSPLVAKLVEFLPISTAGTRGLYVMHPLLRVDLGRDAVVTPTRPGENITVVRKYSFAPGQLTDGMHVFQVRQAPGSPGRDAGYPVSGVLVSSRFKKLCEKAELRGVTFEKVWPDASASGTR
jgi:hypothetical protein